MTISALGAALLFGGAIVEAQQSCPWNGDEPAVFTHFVDQDPQDGLCDTDTNGNLVESRRDVVGGFVHENGLYPDCIVDPATGERQVPHGHWEYTRFQQDPRIDGDTEEKDYATQPQALREDFENMDPNGTATRRSFGRTMRFTLNEPTRFDRAFRPDANPSGYYWQVDEWIGPSGGEPGQEVPLLTWTERFFECASEQSELYVGPCWGAPGEGAVYGGYWSDHRSGFDVDDCGDGLTTDGGRDPRCGMLFVDGQESCP